MQLLSVLKHWLQEPLLHFLLAGGMLFAVYAWLDRGGDAPHVVRVTAAEVDWLKETWTRQWQRPPSEQELHTLVDGYLKEALLAKEAQALGLDENDTVIRRRLAQKMQFLVQDTARLVEPDEAQLRGLYAADSAPYRTPARVSFTQIYFRSEADARQAGDKLKTRNTDEAGERILLERDYAGADEQTLASLFGRGFAAAILALEPGRWQGPIASSYGFHWVWINGREAAQLRPFETVRAQLREAWQRAQQAKADEQFYAGLLKKYRVVVEGAVAPPLSALAAEKAQ